MAGDLHDILSSIGSWCTEQGQDHFVQNFIVIQQQPDMNGIAGLFHQILRGEHGVRNGYGVLAGKTDNTDGAHSMWGRQSYDRIVPMCI